MIWRLRLPRRFFSREQFLHVGEFLEPRKGRDMVGEPHSLVVLADHAIRNRFKMKHYLAGCFAPEVILVQTERQPPP